MERAVLETSSDRYVIQEYLAEGGMGAIYLGKKLGVGGFEKEVVLKQLLPEFTREPKFIDLFLREARLSASLEHANIVHTIDLVNAGDDYFIVMEHVRGADLRTLLRRVRLRRQRLAPEAGIFIGCSILDALAYAHAKRAPDGRPLNLIHRDISPSNILVSGLGEVKLTDFGIAKASTHRSVFYKIKGKVGYMSPEQARGQAVDVRSDLFSLGVVLYEVLVGERLFVGDLMSSASQIYSQPITPPSQKRAEIPAELDAVILKALSLAPEGRFQSAHEFQDALTQVALRQRLLIGGHELAAHLKRVVGEDPAAWLKPDSFDSQRGEPTQSHGTAVLSTGVEREFEPRSQPVAIRAPDAREGKSAPKLPRGELTSIIAIHPRVNPKVDGALSGSDAAGARTPGGEATGRQAALPPDPGRFGGEEETRIRVELLEAVRPMGAATTALTRRRRRPFAFAMLLILVGVGVALAVALSGPDGNLSDPLLTGISSQVKP